MNSWKTWIASILLGIWVLFLSAGAAAGFKVYWHFFRAETGVVHNGQQRDIKRQELVDVVIGSLLKASKEQTETPKE